MIYLPRRSVALSAMFAIAVSLSFSQGRLLDDFDQLSGWIPVTSEGAKLQILPGQGKSGSALVMDFELLGVYGYVIAEKQFDLDLPANYQFTFDLKADIPINNFEFKLIDEQENVFWIKKLNVHYPKGWEKQRIKKRHISFAWGPAGGGEIRKVKAIQFVVSSGDGGKGQVFFDNFRFEPIDDAAALLAQPSVDFSSARKGGEPTFNDKATLLGGWQPNGVASEWLSINYNHQKEIGGVVIDWDSSRYATEYDVQLSDDGSEWTTPYSVKNGNGGRDYIYLPEKEGRFLRINLRKSNGAQGYSIKRAEVKGPEFSASPNDFFTAIAKESPTGLFPKYFLNQQTYWTVVGTSGDSKEALINETGAIEVDKESFSLEPFLYLDGKLVTWNDATRSQSLLSDYMPIPSVIWEHRGMQLTVRTFSAGTPGNSLLITTYRIENNGHETGIGKLFVALRPFQVNPPWQWLNMVGGASRIDSIKYSGGLLQINGKTVIPLTTPAAVGAMEFDNGDITEYLQRGTVPSAQRVYDHTGFASAALAYDYRVNQGDVQEFHIATPFHRYTGTPEPNMSEGGEIYTSLALSSTVQFWESKLDNVGIDLPASAQAIINTVKSNLAYIFINRDGPGIQPGSRSYERSWIRDGSLTSLGLLQLGVRDEAREFVDWYADYQFPSGKIPCVVDTRGGDPTNEHDSHGQFIFAVMSYFRYSHDTTWLRTKFDRVVRTVRFIQSLRAERKTDIYKNGTAEQRACYGLVPESISHEGYWDVPRHSYWDDFFILRGLKDAAEIAEVLGEKNLAIEFANERDDFRKDLYNSMRLAMKNTGIDYIPGCVELGDFDATSTTVGLNPANELGNIPEPALHRTFDKYWENFVERRKNTKDWVNYTPYETRVIGSFIHLGQKHRAHEAVEYFMNDRRPAGWNHWAEVVWRDPSTPKFIGDMPHTWVGSDFIRSVRTMFVYEREQDDALVVGAGIADAWLEDSVGVRVTSLPTYYGPLSYSMTKSKNIVTVNIGGGINVPRGRIVLVSPLVKTIKGVTVNGKRRRPSGSEIRLDTLPAKVEITY